MNNNNKLENILPPKELMFYLKLRDIIYDVIKGINEDGDITMISEVTVNDPEGKIYLEFMYNLKDVLNHNNTLFSKEGVIIALIDNDGFRIPIRYISAKDALVLNIKNQ